MPELGDMVTVRALVNMPGVDEGSTVTVEWTERLAKLIGHGRYVLVDPAPDPADVPVVWVPDEAEKAKETPPAPPVPVEPPDPKTTAAKTAEPMTTAAAAGGTPARRPRSR